MLQEYSQKITKLRDSVDRDMDRLEEITRESYSTLSESSYPSIMKNIVSEYQQILFKISNLEENVRGISSYAQSKDTSLFWKKHFISS